MNQTQVTPATPGLAGQPGLEDIFVLLCSGWPAARVAKLVGQKYGVTVSTTDIAEYEATIPATNLLSLESISDQFQGFDVVVDVVGEMNSLLGLMRDRIMASQLIEDNTGRPNGSLTGMIKTYFVLLEKYADALRSFGILPISKPPAAPVRPADGDETLREVLAGKRAISAVHPPALHAEGVGEARLLRSTNNVQVS